MPVLAVTALALVGCGGAAGENAASRLAKAPELPTDKQAKCKVAKSQSEPLIVEWPDAARGKLESLRKRGLVVVRYAGCELEVLGRCNAKQEYFYSPITRKQSKVTIKEEDELYANMPVGAVKLEGKLRTAGQLTVQMSLVGRYETTGKRASVSDLEGDCDGATHVVTALSVGAFSFYAGSDADVGGGAKVGVGGVALGSGGARSVAARELLQKDGDEQSCVQATAADKMPPEGCGALLQLEVAPLGRAAAKTAIVAPPVPACGPGEHREGATCAPDVKPDPAGHKPPCRGQERLVRNANPKLSVCLPPECAPGERLDPRNATRCVADPPADPPPLPSACPDGTHREGTLCVEDYGSPFRPMRTVKDVPPPYEEPRPTPPPQESGSGTRVLFGYTAVGAYLVALTTGSLALAASKKAKEGCNETTKVCSAEAFKSKDQAMTYAIIADVSLAVGIACTVGAIFWPKSSSPKTRAVGLTPLPGGGFLSAEQRF